MKNRGFSLVEVMVAMVVLTIGVLGLAASAGAITRLTSEGVRAAGASAVAASRFETLRAQTCTAMTASGSVVNGPYTEVWRVTTPAGAAFSREITVVVSYSNGRRTRYVTYVTERSCAPQAG